MTAAGDELRAAIVALYPELYRRARGWLPAAAAEDLVHDAIVRALTFAGQYTAGTNARAWLHRLLRNAFVTRARRHRIELDTERELAELPGAWFGQERTPARPDFSPPVARALASIPGTWADALLAVEIGERSYAEAAAELGIPLGTVMSRIHRGRRALAAQLGAP